MNMCIYELDLHFYLMRAQRNVYFIYSLWKGHLLKEQALGGFSHSYAGLHLGVNCGAVWKQKKTIVELNNKDSYFNLKPKTYYLFMFL